MDFIDLTPRSEEVPKARGKPSMLQLQIQPAYAAVIHKLQALTIPDRVLGCLEGVFAHGQIYVLWSRVTNPDMFSAIGLPPIDILDEVAQAWRDTGLDVEACLKAAAEVTNDWCYRPAGHKEDPTVNIAARLTSRWDHQRRVPLKLKTLSEVLNPQPTTAKVLTSLLQWIDDQDRLSAKGASQGDNMDAAFKTIFQQ